MSTSIDKTATLRSEEHGHQPIVLESNQNHATVSEDGVCNTLPASMGMGGGYVPMITEPIVYDGQRRHGYEPFGDVCETIQAQYGTGGNNVPIVQEPTSWDGSQTSPTLTANNAGGEQRMPDKDNFNCVIQPTMIEMTSTKNTVVDDGISPTLTARMGTGGNQVNAVQCMDVGWFDIQEDKSPSLLARQYKDPPCIGIDRSAFNQGMNAQFKPAFDENLSAAIVERGPNAVCTAVDCRNGTEDEVNGTLQSTACHNTNSNNVSRAGSVVRRLTPGECESLQGFPKNWTDIGDWVDTKGKTHKAADSPRYKALGNSIAVGFDNERRGWWMWLMKRISAQYERRATLGSLFDGIGGFPLAWESINGKGSARWASEIEEFPIAVTKIRFPEE